MCAKVVLENQKMKTWIRLLFNEQTDLGLCY